MQKRKPTQLHLTYKSPSNQQHQGSPCDVEHLSHHFPRMPAQNQVLQNHDAVIIIVWIQACLGSGLLARGI